MSDEFVPVLIVALLVLIPIVSMLLGHQKEMAKLVHAGSKDEARLAALEAELAELRDRMNQQALELERLRTGNAVATLADRVGTLR